MSSSGNQGRINFRSIILIVGISLAIYFLLLYQLLQFEELADGATIRNFFDAVWWSVVTITTVGFGDTYPVTVGGRIIGFVFLMVSLSFYAILIGRITTLISTIVENRKMGYYGMKFKGHSVILGWGSFGKMVTDQLVAAGKKVAIVTREKNNIDLIREIYSATDVFTLYSDISNVDVLEKVNISESSIVFINLDDDTEKLVFFLNIKKHYNKLRYIVTIDNPNLKDTFLAAGVTYAVSKTALASKLIASYIFEPDVASYSEEIMSYAESDDHYDMKEFQILQNNPYLGQYYTKLYHDIKKECNAILVGIVKVGENKKRTLLKNPEGSITVNEGDYLILISNQKTERQIVKLFGTEEGYIE